MALRLADYQHWLERTGQNHSNAKMFAKFCRDMECGRREAYDLAKSIGLNDARVGMELDSLLYWNEVKDGPHPHFMDRFFILRRGTRSERSCCWRSSSTCRPCRRLRPANHPARAG